MIEYSFDINQKALAIFNSLKGTDRAALLDIFTQLSSDPHRRPDFVIRTRGQRDQFVRTFQKWHITYWVDPFANEVRITDLKKV